MGAAESKQPLQKQAMLNEYAEGLENPEDSLDLTDGKAANGHGPAATISDHNKPVGRAPLQKGQSVMDPLDAAAMEIDPAAMQYPFENLVMEGGGNKGLAYVGAVKCFEELGLMDQIKRIGGASAGAIAAAMVAVGFKSDELLYFLSQDIASIIMDHSWGYFSLLPNLVRNFGWNPGNKVHDWFGQTFKDKMGDADITFLDLYKARGIELCIVVTNLNLLAAEYCHPKTTPNMPIRDALRMTMAIPGLLAAMPYDNHGSTDVYVDGGVLVNFPLNCFDGWYLSMAKRHSFLHKLNNLDEFQKKMAPSNRFKSKGQNKTVGLLLFDDAEREIMRFDLEKRYGTLQPPQPCEDTPLWLEKQQKKAEQDKVHRTHKRIVRAVDNFLTVLSGANDKDPEFITKEELRAAFDDKAFLQKSKELLFGKDCDLKKAFDILDKDGNNKIAFFELIQFIEERGIHMQVRYQGYRRREVKSLCAFFSALQETLLTNLKYTAVTEKDVERTVGINTGHVGTMDYNLIEADRQFMVDRGYNATMSFLRYYAVEHPDDVIRKSDAPTTPQSH